MEALCSLISSPFGGSHISRRQDQRLPSLLENEEDRQVPSWLRPSQREIHVLTFAVTFLGEHDLRPVFQDVMDFLSADPMLGPKLLNHGLQPNDLSDSHARTPQCRPLELPSVRQHPP